MLLFEIYCEEVFVDEDGNILTETAIRQYKRLGTKIVKRYRCLSGRKMGKLVTVPGSCGQRKDPKKIRLGRKIMRTKKGIIQHKGKISKRRQISKMVRRMNKRSSK